jgi:hypothetical protein
MPLPDDDRARRARAPSSLLCTYVHAMHGVTTTSKQTIRKSIQDLYTLSLYRRRINKVGYGAG